MEYKYLKEQLLSMFDSDKLHLFPEEWGFCNKMLREAGMTHAFFHAPLDDADFGTSASLAQALGMKGCKKVMPYREQYYGGVAGEIVPTDFESFAASLSHILQENVRCHRNNDRPVCRIAVAEGGSGAGM